MDLYIAYIETPLGELTVASTQKGLCLLDFERTGTKYQQVAKEVGGKVIEKDNEHIALLKNELQDYFSGNLQIFTVPLYFIGTDFQKKVWEELVTIPYGKTISYLTLAQNIGNPKAVRAVANSNALNKISVIVPCHRVIGSNGTLTGYAGGLDKKKWLLDLETKKHNLFSGV